MAWCAGPMPISILHLLTIATCFVARLVPHASGPCLPRAVPTRADTTRAAWPSLQEPHKYLITERGEISVKGKGLMEVRVWGHAMCHAVVHVTPCVLAAKTHL